MSYLLFIIGFLTVLAFVDPTNFVEMAGNLGFWIVAGLGVYLHHRNP